jgi:hypothetical protein
LTPVLRSLGDRSLRVIKAVRDAHRTFCSERLDV